MDISLEQEHFSPYFQLCKEFTDENVDLAKSLVSNMTVHNDFLSEAEEKSILDEIEPYLKRMRYEFDHWDDVSFYHRHFRKYWTSYFRQYMVFEKRNA